MTKEIDKLVVRVDAVITDEQYKECVAAVKSANEHILRLQRENADLCARLNDANEQLAKARDPQRIGGTADPESFVYAIEQLREFRWQHATNDEEAIPYINNVADAHERESAKLREQLKVHEGAYDVLTASIREKRQRINDLEDQLARHGLPIGGQAENAKLREYAAKAWGLFIEHGAVDSCDLHEVDAVKDGLRELGVIE